MDLMNPSLCYGCSRPNEEVMLDPTPSGCEFHPDEGGQTIPQDGVMPDDDDPSNFVDFEQWLQAYEGETV